VSGRTVFFELTILGDTARMAAVDEATGVEAVVIGPAHTVRADLETLALRKLERQLGEAPPRPAPRRGRLV
jgi:hypothetical protein